MDHATSPLEPPNLGHEQLSLFRGKNRWVKKWEVASTSEEGRLYVVAVDVSGRFGCSCPAWVFDSERKPCKHIKGMANNPC